MAVVNLRTGGPPEVSGFYLVRVVWSFPRNCRWLVAEYDDGTGRFYSESSESRLDDVTHWSPLPEGEMVSGEAEGDFVKGKI